jgi:acylglycerol lipase
MYSTDWLNTADKTKLRIRSWKPESGKPRACIALIHGMGEHTGRYGFVAEYFIKENIAVAAMDLRGHGESEGRRGHAASPEVLMEDLSGFIDWMLKRNFDVPAFLYGHSLGGGLVLYHAITQLPRISGVIATSPYLRLAFAPPAWKVSLGKLSAKLVPTLTQPTGLDTTALSRDPAVIEHYKNDPLVHDRITSSMFVSISHIGKFALEHAKEIQTRALIIHGTADRITSHRASIEFADRAEKRVKYILYPGFFHETHNEPEKFKVLSDIVKWINEITGFTL